MSVKAFIGIGRYLVERRLFQFCAAGATVMELWSEYSEE